MRMGTPTVRTLLVVISASSQPTRDALTAASEAQPDRAKMALKQMDRM
jgi:hypothetical protein